MGPSRAGFYRRARSSGGKAENGFLLTRAARLGKGEAATGGTQRRHLQRSFEELDHPCLRLRARVAVRRIAPTEAVIRAEIAVHLHHRAAILELALDRARIGRKLQRILIAIVNLDR